MSVFDLDDDGVQVGRNGEFMTTRERDGDANDPQLLCETAYLVLKRASRALLKVKFE
jgi:hypothetical protein